MDDKVRRQSGLCYANTLEHLLHSSTGSPEVSIITEPPIKPNQSFQFLDYIRAYSIFYFLHHFKIYMLHRNFHDREIMLTSHVPWRQYEPDLVSLFLLFISFFLMMIAALLRFKLHHY